MSWSHLNCAEHVLIHEAQRIFYIFTRQFLQLSFLRSAPVDSSTPNERKGFTENDDLDLCLYYLRTISNVFRWAPDAIWSILATKTVSPDDFPGLAEISKNDCGL